MSDQPPPPSNDPYAPPPPPPGGSDPYAAPQSTPYAQPTSSYAQTASPYSSAPGAGGKSPILSILSLIAGIVGIVGCFVVFIPFVGGVMQLFIPAAAVVLGFIGKRKEPQASKGLWLTGIILGFVGIAIALLSFVLWGLLFAVADSSGYSTY